MMRQPARAAWGTVAVLTALSTVSYTDRFLLNLLVDPVKRTLLLDDTQIALIQGFGFTLEGRRRPVIAPYRRLLATQGLDARVAAR